MAELCNRTLKYNIMKKIAFIFSITLILTASACKKKSETTTTPTPSSTTTTTTGAPVQVSAATITVTSGAQTTTITGSCGWASAGGVHYIGAHDQNKNLRIFDATFNIENPPAQTTTYTLVAYNVNDTDPTHVSMSISEQIGNGLLEWDSSNSSGTITLVVTGNKVTVDLSGITLPAQTNSGFFTNLNTGDYANAGVLSGSLTFYK